MFFILSKILAFLTQPFFYVVVLLILSFLIKKEDWSKKLRVWSLVMLLFFSNSFIVDEVGRLWEVQTKHVDDLPVYDYGIVLGGMMNPYDEEFNRINFHGGVDRLLQTLMLYKRGKIKKILITSGSARLLERDRLEAQVLGDYLVSIGIDEEDLILETQSDNTHENAELTVKLLNEMYGELYSKKKCLLITSASHMRRASACFQKEGLSFDTFSANRQFGPRKFELDHLILPNIGSFGRWNNLAHEIIGYITYWMMGYI